jgi:methylmalonyl-CoA mutase
MQALGEEGVSPQLVARSTLADVWVGTNYFMEIAKLRALQYLAAKLFAINGVPEVLVPIAAQTSHYCYTPADPNSNLLRNTTSALSAVMGGASYLTIGSHYGPGASEAQMAEGQRLGRNISILLREESLLGSTADPAGGSYYIDRLTHQLAEKSWALFQTVMAEGGLAAWHAQQPDSKLHSALAATRQKREAAYKNGTTVLIGGNRYPNPSPEPAARIEEEEAPLGGFPLALS